MLTLLLRTLVTAISSLPSRLKSARTMRMGVLPAVRDCPVVKVPSPRPEKMLTPPFATAASSLPSPLKSPSAAWLGRPAGDKTKGAPNSVPAPVVTLKCWVTLAAGGVFTLPGCDAVMLQLPIASTVTVVALTVQTGKVELAKATDNPDVDVAVSAKGALPSVL